MSPERKALRVAGNLLALTFAGLCALGLSNVVLQVKDLNEKASKALETSASLLLALAALSLARVVGGQIVRVAVTSGLVRLVTDLVRGEAPVRTIIASQRKKSESGRS